MACAPALRLPLLLAFASGAASCSFMELDDFGGQTCQIDDDCDAANLAAHIEVGSQCMAYRCNSVRGRGYCELAPRDEDGDETFDPELCAGELPDAQLDCADRDSLRSPRLSEQCDGIDNDCDGAIDEGALPEDAPPPVPVGDGVTELAYTVTEDGTALLALTSQAGAEHSTSRLLLGDDLAQPVLATEEPDCEIDGGCNFAQIALDATRELVLDMGVNVPTCLDGQIRIGVGSLAPMRFDLGMGTPPPASSLAAGIDIEGANLCTVSTACQGARDVALALLHDAPAASETVQGLALWLAPDDERCTSDPRAFDADSPRALVGLGLRAGQVRQSTQHGDSAWLEANPSAGTAVLLRGITAPQRPALLAWTRGPDALPSGYLIAHIDEQGPVLLAMPRMEAATDALHVRPAGRIDDPEATRVALAASPDRDLKGLALAWRSRAGNGDSILFAELQLTSAAAEGAEITVHGDPITLARASAIVEGPVVAFAPTGFSATEPAGGWLVAWVETGADGRRLMAARVAQADRRVLGAPLELARGELHHVFTYAKRARLEDDQRFAIRYGFLRGKELRVAEASCLPPE